MRLSLAKKMIFGGSALVAITIMALGWYAYNTASNGITEQARISAHNMALRIADMAQMVMQEEVKLAADLAVGNTTIEVAKKVAKSGIAGSQDARARLDAKLTAFKASKAGADHEAIVVADLNGDVYASSLGKKVKLNLSQRNYFKLAKRGEFAAGDVVFSKISGKPVTTIGVPIKDPAGGAVIGVMVTVIDIGFLVKRISGFKVGETGYAWMANDQGLFISHLNPKIILKDNIKQLAGMAEVASLMLEGKDGVKGYTYKGVDKTLRVRPGAAHRLVAGLYHER